MDRIVPIQEMPVPLKVTIACDPFRFASVEEPALFRLLLFGYQVPV